MQRRGWGRRIAGVLLIGGCGLVLYSCGTEVASGGIPERSPSPGVRPASPTPPGPPTSARPPSPRPPKPTCPASGASISVGSVDAALGHRAVVVKLTNCRSKTITLDGYPAVTVLDAKHRTLPVKVTHGLSYMAIDPGPTKLQLRKGESALAAVSWSNTVEAGDDKAAGTYLTVAPAAGRPAITWPVDTDLGTTAKLTLTAWCRKFPT